MKQIQLTKGKVTLVDDDVYEWAKDYNWCTHRHGKIWYALRSCSIKDSPDHKQHTVYLHHCVVGFPLHKNEIDHIDGDGLNNQRFNLRIVSHPKNMQNQIPHRKGHLLGTSLAKTKYKNKIYTYWQATIVIDGEHKYLGLYSTEQEAHEAYLKALKEGVL